MDFDMLSMRLKGVSTAEIAERFQIPIWKVSQKTTEQFEQVRWAKHFYGDAYEDELDLIERICDIDPKDLHVCIAGLPKRAINAFINSDLKTLGAVAETFPTLRSGCYWAFGSTTLEQTKSVLRKHGLLRDLP